MRHDALTVRARALWAGLAGAPVEFAPAISFAISPQSSLCPPGWIGIVVIEGGAIATAPDQETALRAQHAIGGVPAVSALDVAVLSGELPAAQLHGPATLAYLDAADFRPRHGPAPARPLDPHDPVLRRFLSTARAAELEESGMDEITSPAFAVVEHGHIVAVAGYRSWPGRIAHLSVLTAAEARGRGLAQVAASGAVSHAIEADKLPQWRARPRASRRVAAALGFRELGSQLSARLAAP